jgi:hypothetical protein
MQDCIIYSGRAPDFPGLAVVALQMQYQDFGELYKPDTSLSLANTKYITRGCQPLFFASALRIRIHLIADQDPADPAVVIFFLTRSRFRGSE